METIVDTVRPAIERAEELYRERKDTVAARLENLTENAGGVVRVVAAKTSTVLLQVCIVLIIAWILLTVAVALYSGFRFMYLPASHHVAPVHLDFNISSGYPVAELQLAANDSWLLRAGQAYDVSVALHVPESEVNKEFGMVMVELTLHAGAAGKTWASKRHTMLQYRSTLNHVLTTLFWAPLLVTNFRDESQRLYVFMFQDFVDHSAHPVTAAMITLDKPLQLYSAELRFDAHFTGLRHYMYWYPLTTGTVIISAIFLAEVFVTLMLVAVIVYFMHAPTEDLSDLDRDTDVSDAGDDDTAHTDVGASARSLAAVHSVSADGLRLRQ